MTMKQLFVALLLIPAALSLPAQDVLTIAHSCSYDGEESERDFYQFDPSNEADRIVAEIVNAVSLAKNFTVKSSNVKNALATTVSGQRYILYSTGFLEKFKSDAKTRWAAYSVLAHEIGHHLNGHNFSETEPARRKRMELEADKFSGGVLQLLGASLDEAQAGIETFGLEGETRTHPPRSARREAIASGWKKQEERRPSVSGARDTPTRSNEMRPPSPDKKADPSDGTVSKMPENSNRQKATDFGAAQLVGTWKAEITEQGEYKLLLLELTAEGGETGVVYDRWGQLLATALAAWTYQNGQMTETDLYGNVVRSKIRWIDQDSFEVTIIDNGIPGYAGVKRIFQRYKN
jgi:hypothetical protein